MKKAVALISGGLDSMLAVRIIQEQGIYVEGINFFTGFCVEGHTHAIRNQHREKPKRNNALWVAEQLGIKLHIIDIVEEYKQFYSKNPFIRIVDEIETKNVNGTNFCDIKPCAYGGKIIIISALDNLIKGGAGQAVQNFNLMHGFDETTGLI